MCSAPGRPNQDIRDVLFGDLPLAEWPAASVKADEEPWLSFAAARASLDAGDKFRAIQLLQHILALPALESRHYLQAWHVLRQLGLQPGPKVARELHGVVVEVALEQGLDLVAAYADRTARYFNYSGAAVVWDAPNHDLDTLIENVLQAGRAAVAIIGPSHEARPPAPGRTRARVNMLTPSGIHFGEGPFSLLAADPLCGPVIEAATHLMLTLMALSEQGKT